MANIHSLGENIPGHFSWKIPFSRDHWPSIGFPIEDTIAKTASLKDWALKSQSRNKAATWNAYVLEHQTSITGPDLIQNCIDFFNVDLFQLWLPELQILLVNCCEPFSLYSLGSKPQLIFSLDTKFPSKTFWDHIERNTLL